MTRQEAINHWAEYVIPSVFKAEDKLRPQLKKIIADNKDDHERAAKLYCQAIATEIVSHTTDEQMEQADHLQTIEDEYHHKMTYPN